MIEKCEIYKYSQIRMQLFTYLNDTSSISPPGFDMNSKLFSDSDWPPTGPSNTNWHSSCIPSPGHVHEVCLCFPKSHVCFQALQNPQIPCEIFYQHSPKWPCPLQSGYGENYPGYYLAFFNVSLLVAVSYAYILSPTRIQGPWGQAIYLTHPCILCLEYFTASPWYTLEIYL